MKLLLATIFISTSLFAQKPSKLMMIPSLELDRSENSREYFLKDKTLKLNRDYQDDSKELKYESSKNSSTSLQLATLKYTSDTKKYIASISESESQKDYPMSITRHTHSPYTQDSFMTKCLEHHNPNAQMYQECFSVNKYICQNLDYDPTLFNKGNSLKQVKAKRVYLKRIIKLLENEEKYTKAGRKRTHYMSQKQREYFSQLYKKEKNLWEKLTEETDKQAKVDERSSRNIIIDSYLKLDKLYSVLNTGSLIDGPLKEFKKTELRLSMTLKSYQDLCNHADKAEIFTVSEEYGSPSQDSSSRQ